MEFLNQPGAVALLALAAAAFNFGQMLLFRRPVQDLKNEADRYSGLVDNVLDKIEKISTDHHSQVSRILDVISTTADNYAQMVDRSIQALDTSNDRLGTITLEVIDRLPGRR